MQNNFFFLPLNAHAGLEKKVPDASNYFLTSSWRLANKKLKTKNDLIHTWQLSGQILPEIRRPPDEHVGLDEFGDQLFHGLPRDGVGGHDHDQLVLLPFHDVFQVVVLPAGLDIGLTRHDEDGVAAEKLGRKLVGPDTLPDNLIAGIASQLEEFILNAILIFIPTGRASFLQYLILARWSAGQTPHQPD